MITLNNDCVDSVADDDYRDDDDDCVDSVADDDYRGDDDHDRWGGVGQRRTTSMTHTPVQL